MTPIPRHMLALQTFPVAEAQSLPRTWNIMAVVDSSVTTVQYQVFSLACK